MKFFNFINEMAKFNAFHGSPITNIEAFKIGKEGRDEKGPGMYFTSSEDDARRYATNKGRLYKVEIQIKRPIPIKGKTREYIIVSLARDSLGIKPGPFQEQLDKLGDSTWLSNWNENKRTAFYDGINSIMESYPNEPYEAYTQAWADFYKLDSERYLKKMLFWYDGVVLPSKEPIHYIVFDPKQIKIIG